MTLFSILINSLPSEGQISFGLFADCQYCDCDARGSRYYRNSLNKLMECIETFNRQEDLSFIANVGDLIDRDFAGFDAVNAILANSKHDVYQVPGNHDYEVEDGYLEKVPFELGLTKMYYSLIKNGWMFIFLNGNDISFKSAKPGIISQAQELTDRIKNDGGPNFHKWNGAIGNKQLNWMKRQLKQSEKKKFKVAVFCHYPVLPVEAHTLWNHAEVLDIIEKFNTVKIWINGHNHAGGYSQHKGIHFVTMKGMVETESENSFAIVKLTGNTAKITGYGREVSRELSIE